ncbi:MAG: NUDIX domain-containing protein [Muribaculaceae bacterium]|nr:NUDIX domain-containing protein [Muribaculaceae bacterium]
MRFRYCPDCGALLSGRVLGDEGEVPWCDACGKPWFDMFPVAVISLVHNEKGEVLLLRQNYISTEFHNLVSGYVTPGEDAESCAVREIFEETGQEVEQLELVLTNWFARKEMMMIGFFARVRSGELRLSSEVDAAAWHKPEEILSLVSSRPGSTSRILCERFLSRAGVSELETAQES